MKTVIDPYLALILVGFLPNEIWRWLGVMVGHGLDEESEIILWIRAVATALIAGVIARILLFPPGALASVPLALRLTAIAAGLLAYVLIRRSALAGVLVGEAVLIAGALLYLNVVRMSAAICGTATPDIAALIRATKATAATPRRASAPDRTAPPSLP